jgi:spore germination protein YaaH
VIGYELRVKSEVWLRVYDLLGRHVATLVEEMQDAGYKSVQFDAGNLASGVYFYRLSAGRFVQSRKLVIQK